MMCSHVSHNSRYMVSAARRTYVGFLISISTVTKQVLDDLALPIVRCMVQGRLPQLRIAHQSHRHTERTQAVGRDRATNSICSVHIHVTLIDNTLYSRHIAANAGCHQLDGVDAC